jgi:phosphate transport system substrate-binding protein
VADSVSRTEGAIGYVESGFAVANRLPAGRVKNRAGQYVAASPESVTAAAAAVLRDGIPADLRLNLTDAPGPQSYPVVGTTWAVIFLDGPAGAELGKFLRWAVRDGQAHATELRYAPLPAELLPAVDAVLARLK